MSEINNWKVLHNLKPQFVDNIKILCLLGEKTNDVLIVSNDDKVYAFGDNSSGILGLGHKNAILEPNVVQELTNKQIVDIKYGLTHVLVLTQNGNVFSWGDNTFGQLGYEANITDKPKMIDNLSNGFIVSMSCGFYHSLVLLQNGCVYGFGFNNSGQIGCGNQNNQRTPVWIHPNYFQYSEVTEISCGSYHSLALTRSGTVFSWGQNSFGQLGLNDFNNQNIPTKLSFNSTFKSISCGQNHSLLLTIDGFVYTFGCNKFGQIGNGNKGMVTSPIKITSINKIIEIGSELRSNISVAKASLDFCYVWGEYNGEVITNPMQTSLNSIHDIFSNHSNKKFSYKAIQFRKKPVNKPFMERLINAFNDRESSDFQFKIKEKLIYTHKVILKINCEHFKAMFSENWDKNDTKQIEIDLYSYPVYYSFLKYIYTNCVDIGIEDTIELYDLANSYLEEDLKQKCIQIIRSKISISNVLILYSNAVKCDSLELENICLKFMAININEICISEGFKQMDSQLCKRFIENATKLQAFKSTQFQSQ